MAYKITFELFLNVRRNDAERNINLVKPKGAKLEAFRLVKGLVLVGAVV